jgi:hypothetical protein
MLYAVLVASSVLRFRVRLVIYVTMLSISAYLFQILYAQMYRPETAPNLLQATPFLICLVVIGLIQLFALRRSVGTYANR